MNKKQNANIFLLILNIDFNFSNQIIMYAIRTNKMHTFYIKVLIQL